jgi:molybdopterin synthase catalytic subunit
MPSIGKEHTRIMIADNEHSFFVEGPVSPALIAEYTASAGQRKDAGAHGIFLGKVRSDMIDGKVVAAIDYSTYREMAEEIFQGIRERTMEKYGLISLHIFHSIGIVRAGEISLFVSASSAHRAEAFDACRSCVEEIKSQAPVWGRELFDDSTYSWKVNTN